MKERLTHQKWSDDIDLTQEYGYSYIYKRLYEYEDLEEQGLIVRLPCKVGDKIYIVLSPFGELDEWEITSIQIFENNLLFRLGHKGTDDYAAIWSKELGDSAFFTRPEAEKKLKELRGGV